MPIRHAIQNLVIDPNNFDPEQIKADLLREFDADETAWKAAITQRDTTLTETQAALQKAQAAAWDLLQQQPAEQPQETKGQRPSPEDDETVVTFDDMFTKVEKE